jgi:hypothetical protein
MCVRISRAGARQRTPLVTKAARPAVSSKACRPHSPTGHERHARDEHQGFDPRQYPIVSHVRPQLLDCSEDGLERLSISSGVSLNPGYFGAISCSRLDGSSSAPAPKRMDGPPGVTTICVKPSVEQQ